MLVFAALPAILVGLFTIGVIGHHFAFDFHTFWTAARQIRKGRSPYPAASAIATAHSATGNYQFFVYPPPFVLALVPFSLVPFAAAAALFTVLLLGCLFVALPVLGVRDWRCYGVMFAAIPTLSSLRLGEVTPVLVLLLALAWRYRDHWPVAGAAVGAAVVLKLFVWPLVVWLLVTRRWKAAAAAVCGGIAVTAIAWAAIGFRGFGEYPTLLRDLTRVEEGQGYSLVALADRLNLPDPRLSWLALAFPVVAGLVVMCARSTTAAFDRRVYSTAVCLALLLTPILWLNYFTLIVIPVALARPTLSIEWALPLAFWISPFQEPARQPAWRLAIVLAIVIAGATSGSRSEKDANRGRGRASLVE